MGKVINLRKARKTRARKDKAAKADANAARHGRTKAQKTVEDAAAAKARRDLDGHRIE
ncbi:MAG: DUF4169 family protein [Pseudomonadota bacterium]